MKQHLLLLVAGLMASISYGQPYSALVNFGDSLSAYGNPGISTSTTTSYPSSQIVGTWVKQIANEYGLPGLASSKGGTLYAVGGAVTQDMFGQVSRCINDKRSDPDTSLYFIMGGANDIGHYAEKSPLDRAGLLTTAETAARNIKAQITTLIHAGAKRFVWGNIPPLSKTPHGQMFGTLAKVILDPPAERFNQRWAQYSAELQTQFPGIVITKVDLYDMFTDISIHQESYGFTNVTDPCEGLNVNPDKYLFWDGVHPTSRGHQILANLTMNLLGTPPAESAGNDLISYEGFEYPATLNISSSLGSATDVGLLGNTWSSENDVIAPGLRFGILPTEGNAMLLNTSVAAQRTINPLTMPASHTVTGVDGIKRLGAIGSTVWMAFLIRADGADLDGTKTASLSLLGSATGGAIKLRIGDLGTSANWSVATASLLASNARIVTGQTTLLVAKIKFFAGTGNDEVELFVNPPLSATEPTTPSARLRNTYVGPFDKVEFKATRATAVDELYIGKSWADLAGAASN